MQRDKVEQKKSIVIAQGDPENNIACVLQNIPPRTENSSGKIYRLSLSPNLHDIAKNSFALMTSKQEKRTNCGTKAGNVLANFWPANFNANELNISVHLQLL